MSPRIFSQNSQPFQDREEAGRLLAKELRNLGGKETVVLGIPRGGMIVAAEVSRLLGADLDIVLARKIGAPGNPEFAIGAVSEDGREFVDQSIALQVGADEFFIQEAKARQLEMIANRKNLYRKAQPKVSLKQRLVIIVDDGLATGATMQAALWSAREEGPGSIIAALPVASKDGLEKIAGYADEAFCLRAPDYFSAVSQFYRQFPEVTDKEVLEILARMKSFREKSQEKAERENLHN
ncbi:MAG: phosphoribosyltransferase family protein [Candidatus Omnitrophota bacterium]|nr:phosphoribosyltransferase family protein [Candidatus Omnitrophota bacterium]